MKNEKEFLELKTLYKRIDVDWLEEIAERFDDAEEDEWAEALMTEISGFGTRGSCTLCKAVMIPHFENENLIAVQERHALECSKCAYTIMTSSRCYDGINTKTYNAFVEARDTEQLEKACDAREKHMETIYNRFKQDKENSDW